jgi:hypothetical protein
MIRVLGFGVWGLGFGDQGRNFRVQRFYIDLQTQTCLVESGGVNRCPSHCRLAKFRGLMDGGKYSAVIRQKTRWFRMRPVWISGLWARFKPITAPHFLPYIRIRNVAKRQCEWQRLTLPTVWRQREGWMMRKLSSIRLYPLTHNL